MLGGVHEDDGCVTGSAVVFVLSDSLKLYLVQVKAGADMREGAGDRESGAERGEE